jgi:hypothetical protein
MVLFLSGCKTDYLTPGNYPSLLEGPAGQKIKSVKLWENVQRPFILALFEKEMYGKRPDNDLPLEFRLSNRDTLVIHNIRAIREQAKLIFYNIAKTDSQVVDLLLYMPAEKSQPVPVFLGMNFYGNQTVTKDTNIFVTKTWVRDVRGITNNRADEKSRGISASSWPLDLILSRGYGLATIHYGDIEPDHITVYNSGIRRLYYSENDTVRAPDEWGAISTWAYGYSCGLDYLETVPEIDKKKIIAIGFSRLGKTALWAGATDRRFAMVVSNMSGCGGAAVSRGKARETVQQINTRFPHWFCGNFKKYDNNEDVLPVDQHMLIALIAPRPVYIGSSEEDPFCHPESEFLAGYYAGDVYALYKKKTLPFVMPPKVDTPLTDGYVGYHMRSGGHAMTRYDWEQYLEFADRRLGN